MLNQCRVCRMVMLLICLGLLGALPLSVLAQEEETTDQRDPEFEQEIADRLAAIDPEAVPIFAAATEAMDQEDYTAAQAGYQQVLDLAPDFPDALRRLSYVEQELGNHEEALKLVERAYEIDPSPTNLAAHALALLRTDNPLYLTRALRMAQEAATDAPDDDYIQVVYFSVAYTAEDEAAILEAAERLVALDFDGDFFPYYFVAINYAETGRFDEADAMLARAAELGFRAEDVEYFATYFAMLRALDEGDMVALEEVALQLIELEPDDPYGYFFAGLALHSQLKASEANEYLDQAEALGWPADQVEYVRSGEYLRDQLLTSIGGASSSTSSSSSSSSSSSAPSSSASSSSSAASTGGSSATRPRATTDDSSDDGTLDRLGMGFIYLVGGWLGGIGILFVVGGMLSQITLTTANSTRFARNRPTTGLERLIRLVYRGVINLAGLFYYVSLPVLAIITLAAGAAIFYGFFAIGRIPVRLALFVLIAVGYTLVAILQSLTARAPDPPTPGRPLKRGEAPDLWAMVEAVAQRVGTRPADKIFITPGTEIAVTEKGSLVQKWRDQGERHLILGLGVLPCLTQNQFQAILAHEYGHFSNRDTAGGTVASYVRYAMRLTAIGLAQGGQARWYNPVWLFLLAYDRIFMRITQGASRLQELLADRYAALAYGPQHFSDGLRNIVEQSVRFDMQVKRAVVQAQKEKAQLENLWTLPPLDEMGQYSVKNLEREVKKIMDRYTSSSDSHPAPNQRIEFVKHIMPAELVPDLPAPTTDLLPRLADLQEELTVRVNRELTRATRHRNLGHL